MADANGAQRPTHSLPTSRLSYDSQLKVLRAFAAAYRQTGEPVSNDDAAKLAEITSNTLSLNNRFFAENGFLERVDREYVPDESVIQFHQTSQWDKEGAVKRLAPIVSNSWFAKAVLPHLTMGPRSEADVTQLIGEAAGAGPDYEKQIATLLDYLVGAGVVERENGTLRLPDNGGAKPPPRTPPPVQDPPAPPPKPPAKPEPPSTGAAREGVGFSYSINVDMAELSTWSADRIRAFFDGIAKVMEAQAGAPKTQEGEGE